MNSKNQYLGEKDLCWYFDKPFCWQAFATFYRISYTRIHRRYCSSLEKIEDFEDVFQSAMLKLCEMINKGKNLETYGHAYCLFRVIFNTTMIDFFENGKKLPLELNFEENYFDNLRIAVCDDEDLIAIESVFVKIDAKIAINPKILPGRKLEFYNHYKKAMLTLCSDEDIMTDVISRMLISKVHYGLLKFHLINLAKSLK